jgi:hypothetical protein
MVVTINSETGSLVYSSTLKMEVTRSSETSVDFQRTTRRYIPQDGTLHSHRCEILKSYKHGNTFQKMFTFIHNRIHNSPPLDPTLSNNNLALTIASSLRVILTYKKNLRDFGPLVNYADRATAACWSSANFCV